MKKSIFFLVALALLGTSCQKKQSKILVFSKTAEFRHGSIEAGQLALIKLGSENNFSVDTTENANVFTEENLKKYAAVVFLNTTGDVLNEVQQAQFERYIQAGGGFVGLHAATDTEYDWPWYAKLVGAYFDNHPRIQLAKLKVENSTHPATAHLPEIWEKTDEWYNFKNINPDLDILISLDESSYEGGKNGNNHPISWSHSYDGGRAFYTGFGHTDETFQNAQFLQHFLGGIQYAMGDGTLDYGKATSEAIPEENRFVKTVLDFNLDEPMELDELPGKGILFIERRGNLKLFDFESETTKFIGKLDLFYGNEDGLLGLAVDPNYEKNNWIYLFYSAAGEKAEQHVSRFTLKGDSLVVSSEKLVLTIPTLRLCCHSGGALEFGPDGNLFIATGDNTNPFESAGFAPIDERPDRALWDAQKSAANTNDLRGKILRIKPEDNGTYSIPEGNLFPKGTAKTRPEIYVMGCRNPFRFSIDSKTGYVYWGDVGPDAGSGKPNRGPKGMGEFNQARNPGFWGWPYTRGNNQTYNDFNFATNTSGPKFDAQQLVNNSPNNTGIQNLPPAQASQIWFSYDASEEFPWLGDGGVNPMSGPVYHKADFTEEANFPDYFENKILLYEWMRDWIYVVTLDKDQNYVTAEPFMPNTEFSHPMDMMYSSNGQLYVLEYGQSWNTRNVDARLSRIQYVTGNRTPIARIESDKVVGANPLTVQFSGVSSEDYDFDSLTYEWSFNDKIQSTSPRPTFTFTALGNYDVSLKVTDNKGATNSAVLKIQAGNDPPVVAINTENSTLFYTKAKAVDYAVEVTDAQDGSTTTDEILADEVAVKFTFIPEGQDRVQQTVGHQQQSTSKGKLLIEGSDCKACHAIDKKVNGPSYQDVAAKYTEKDKAYLVDKVRKGGSGVWGEAMMAPHPTLSNVDAEKIVDYILGLKQADEDRIASLPLTGTLYFDQHQPGQKGVYVLTATYKDKGREGLADAEIAKTTEVVFSPPSISAQKGNEIHAGKGNWNAEGMDLVGSIKNGSTLVFNQLPLQQIKSIDLTTYFGADYDYKGTVEFREGGVDGVLIGKATLGYYNKIKSTRADTRIELDSKLKQGDLYLVFKNENDPNQFVANVNEIRLNFK